MTDTLEHTLETIARLSKLAVNDDEKSALVASVTRMVRHIDVIFTVDVSGVAPMHRPPFHAQPLRADEVKTTLGAKAIAQSAGFENVDGDVVGAFVRVPLS